MTTARPISPIEACCRASQLVRRPAKL